MKLQEKIRHYPNNSKVLEEVDNVINENAKLKDMLSHYRNYFNDLHNLLNDDILGGGFLDSETFDEILENNLEAGSIDYFAMLGHIDSLEEEHKDIIQFPMKKHKNHLNTINECKL